MRYVLPKVILLLLLATPLLAGTVEIMEDGTSEGFVSRINVSTGLDVSRTGITGTVTAEAGAGSGTLQQVTDNGASTDNVLEAAGYDTTRVDAAQYSLWYEPTSATGDEYFGWQANANITTSYVWVAPAADAAGVFKSNGSGVVSISAVAAADTSITAGRSLTWSTNDLVADAELYTQSKSMTIETPTDADNFFFFVAPQALTITKVTGIVEAATSAVITLQECDAAGDNAATIEAVTADVDGTISTDIDNGAIDAGDVIRVDIGTVTGTVGQAHVTVVYTLND
jgi:hypothetical protein